MVKQTIYVVEEGEEPMELIDGFFTWRNFYALDRWMDKLWEEKDTEPDDARVMLTEDDLDALEKWLGEQDPGYADLLGPDDDDDAEDWLIGEDDEADAEDEAEVFEFYREHTKWVIYQARKMLDDGYEVYYETA